LLEIFITNDAFLRALCLFDRLKNTLKSSENNELNYDLPGQPRDNVLTINGQINVDVPEATFFEKSRGP